MWEVMLKAAISANTRDASAWSELRWAANAQVLLSNTFKYMCVQDADSGSASLHRLSLGLKCSSILPEAIKHIWVKDADSCERRQVSLGRKVSDILLTTVQIYLKINGDLSV